MTRILVPVGLDAWVVRAGETPTVARTAWSAPQRPAAGAKTNRQDLAPPPFADLTRPREPGVHLHWAVPDALALRPADATQFPALPCRWLVVRLDGLADGATPRRVTTWLLPNIHAQTPTDVPNGHTTTQPIGSAAPPVTVRGRGGDGPHPSWALGYDDTLGRLAFHDPLTDPGVGGPLAYTVLGWYTHSRLDPLTPPDGTPPTPSWLLARLDELRWTATLPAGTPPTGSLYHGSAVGIGWPAPTWPGDGGTLAVESGGPPAVDQLELALGDNLLAAVAVLLDGPGADAATSAQSEAVLAGADGQLSEPDGLHRLDASRHRSRFRSVAPREGILGAIWTEAPPAAALPAPLPQVVAGLAAGDGVAIPATVTALARGLRSIPAAAGALAGADQDTGRVEGVTYPTPRQWRSGDPVVVAAGLGRTLRHGADGRFDADGLLDCRTSLDTVSAPTSTLPTWTAAADVPPEVGALVRELAALDPGSVSGLGGTPAGQVAPEASARASWWDSFANGTEVWRTTPPGTGWSGVLPSPIAVTPPSRPWSPLRVDWEAELTPTPAGRSHWALGDLDYEPVEGFALAGAGVAPPVTLVGRGWLSPAPVDLLRAVAQRHGDDPAAVAQADAVAAALEGFVDAARGVPAGTWVGSQGVVDVPSPSLLAAETYTPRSLLSGGWRLTRLRVVDTFGQTVALHDSTGPAPVTAAPAAPAELALPGGDDLALRPRFTAPTTLAARVLDPAPASTAEATEGRNPIAGFLLPSPFDGSIELIGPEGEGVGRLRSDSRSRRALLEPMPAPGGGDTDAPLLGALAVVAQLVIGADIAAPPGPTERGALPTLVRVLDETRATVDVTGRAGTAQLSLLLGHPICVLRLGLELTVDDPQAGTANAAQPMPLRLGTLAGLADGVLAWIAEDAPDRLHPIHPAVAADAASPLLGDGLCWLVPGTPRQFVLLVVPGADVTVTSGLVPQKQLTMRREWTDRPLKLLTPTLGLDGLLRDPAAVSLPVPGGIHGTWTWFRRPSAGAAWQAQPVSSDPPTAQPGTPVAIEDGYLRVTLIDDPPYRGIPIRVRCIKRYGRANTIQALGGLNPDGSPWRLPIDTAVQMVESGRFWFYVRITENGVDRDVDLVVDVAASGRKYLRTVFDQTKVNNLLSLPRCP